MDVLYPHCSGIDIHKKSITVCERSKSKYASSAPRLPRFCVVGTGCKNWALLMWRWNPLAFTGDRSGIF